MKLRVQYFFNLLHWNFEVFMFGTEIAWRRRRCSPPWTWLFRCSRHVCRGRRSQRSSRRRNRIWRASSMAFLVLGCLIKRFNRIATQRRVYLRGSRRSRHHMELVVAWFRSSFYLGIQDSRQGTEVFSLEQLVRNALMLIIYQGLGCSLRWFRVLQ